MDVRDLERLEVRREIERIHVRGLELRTAEAQREMISRQSTVQRLEQSFQSVWTRFLERARSIEDPRLRSVSIQQGVAQIKQEKEKILKAKAHLDEKGREHLALIQGLGGSTRRHERLGAMCHDLSASLRNRAEVQAEGIVGEQRIAAALAREKAPRQAEEPRTDAPTIETPSSAEESEQDAFSTDPGSVIETHGTADFSTRSSLTPQASEACANAFAANSSGGGNAGAESFSGSAQEHGAQSSGGAANSTGAAKQITPGHFADKLSELTSWNGAGGVGVTFSFNSKEGRTLQVQLTQVPDQGTVVALAPQSLADQRLMGAQLRELRSTFEKKGLRVAGTHVGAIKGRGSYA